VLRSGESAADSIQGRTPGGAREAELRSEVERLLAARVGEGKAIVSVSVDAATQSERITERLVDPSSRVVISSDNRESTETSTGKAAAGGGAATVASNLPQADGGGESTSSRAETEERINYEVSETTRERVVPAGEVKRLTVAVLVDGVATTDADGERVWQPRTAEELAQLTELVRAAVGYDEARGDVVTVETLEFAERPGSTATAGPQASRFLADNGVALAQMAVFGLVALGLVLFVLRPLMRVQEAPALASSEDGPMLEWPVTAAIEAGPGPLDDDDQMDRIALLKETFTERRDESATVLRGWLEKDVQAQMEAEGQR
jgi:flagellar M-ring protein FliF